MGNLFDTSVLEHIEDRSTKSLYSKQDLIYFFRELNTKILLDEYEFKPNIKNLSWLTRWKCRKLSKKGMIISGSTILKMYGLLDRKTDDIDVYWDIKKAKKENIINEKEIINSFDYIERKNINDSNKITRYKVKNSLFGTLDIFENNQEEENLEYKGILHHHPLNILRVKFNYFRDKDYGDFEDICKKLDINPNSL